MVPRGETQERFRDGMFVADLRCHENECWLGVRTRPQAKIKTVNEVLVVDVDVFVTPCDEHGLPRESAVVVACGHAQLRHSGAQFIGRCRLPPLHPETAHHCHVRITVV